MGQRLPAACNQRSIHSAQGLPLTESTSPPRYCTEIVFLLKGEVSAISPPRRSTANERESEGLSRRRVSSFALLDSLRPGRWFGHAELLAAADLYFSSDRVLGTGIAGHSYGISNLTHGMLMLAQSLLLIDFARRCAVVALGGGSLAVEPEDETGTEWRDHSALP